MNDRVKELMAQAGFDPAAIERIGVMPQAEKFAELIVRECAALAKPADTAIKRIAEQEHAPGNIITVYGSNPYDYCEQYSTNIDHWVAIAHTALDTETKILDHFGLED